jgi:hypothetical protein
MQPTEPSTFVLGVVPFLNASSKATDDCGQSEVVGPAQRTHASLLEMPPPFALKAIARLLARQAAREDFATRFISPTKKELTK